MKYSGIYLCLILLIASCSPIEEPNKANAEAIPSHEYKTKKSSDAKPPMESNKSVQWATNGPATVTSYAVKLESTPDAPQGNLVKDRRLIWNADMEFQVADLDKSFNEIRKLCKRHEGFISNMEHTNDHFEASMNLNVRVSNEHFHDLVAAIKGQSKKLDVAIITSDDVTEEYVDIENRLQTKRQARERYIEILRSKTGTIDEVIQAEEAIRRITEEIEAKEGRLRYLNDQVDYSSIDIRMYKVVEREKPAVAEVPTYGDKAESSFASGLEAIKAIGLFLITIWPLLLIAIALIVWKRKWIREKVALVRVKKEH